MKRNQFLRRLFSSFDCFQLSILKMFHSATRVLYRYISGGRKNTFGCLPTVIRRSELTLLEGAYYAKKGRSEMSHVGSLGSHCC